MLCDGDDSAHRQVGRQDDADLVLTDDFATLLSVGGLVGEVSAGQRKEGVDEVSECASLVVQGTLVPLKAFLGALDQMDRFVRFARNEQPSVRL
jgi:hypothetical protein